MSTLLGPDQAEGLRRMMGEYPSTNTQIIAITSGKGGVGKTSFALNLGISLANMKDNPKKVIVFDADLGLANVHVLMGLIPKYNLYHVIKGQKKMSEIIYKTELGVDIIGGASGFTQLANLGDEEKQNLIEAMKEISYADYIIIDTSAGISKNVLSFVIAAHETIVITTPEPTSMTDAYGIIKAIVTESDTPNIKLVLNRVRNIVEANKVSRKIIDICAQFLNIKIDNFGFIFEDPIIGEAVRKQTPFTVYNPHSSVSLCINHIARRVLNMAYSEEHTGWQKFFGVFFKDRE
ncbi:MAG: MinD/ParA family protein [Brevinematales bacterium]|jgi:flagellar biosynthesis protein FlhG